MKDMENNTVYVLIENIPYEGYNQPIGIFTSKDKAWEYLDRAGCKGYDYEVIAYTIGEYE